MLLRIKQELSNKSSLLACRAPRAPLMQQSKAQNLNSEIHCANCSVAAFPTHGVELSVYNY